MMRARPLPAYLAHRYHGWKATSYADNAPWYRRLAEEGQRPRVMVISCCDSRVHVTSIFGAEEGELFVHRNIAGLVPPCAGEGGGLHGTSATIEYAVRSLHVTNLIVLGHSGCGGVRGCYDMCRGAAPEMEEEGSFVGRWMDILRPGYEATAHIEDEEERVTAMEREAVTVSLRNLATFPFVDRALTDGSLQFHGAWTDIASGALLGFDPAKGAFQPV